MENGLDHINLINTLKEGKDLLKQKVFELTSQLQEKDYNLLYTKEELEKLRRIIFGSRSETLKMKVNLYIQLWVLILVKQRKFWG